MRVLKTLKKHALIPSAVFLIALGLYHQLALHLNTYLLDWLDYPYYAWTMSQVINHLSHFTIQGFFNTNIFYPFQGSLLFSDLLIPQAVMGSIVSIFTQNPVAILNVTFLLTLLLNSITAYYLWHQFFTDRSTLFFGTLVTSLSPFFFLQVSHFQMITLWPFFLTLGLVCRPNPASLKSSVLAGVLIAVQFLASVYLAIFLLTTIGLYYLIKLLFAKPTVRITCLKSSFITMGLAAILITPIIYKYIATQHSYQVERSPGEYITYAAHDTDYLFTTSYRSLGTTLLKSWNRFDQHVVGERAAFPGFALLLSAVVSIIVIKKNKHELTFSITTNPEQLFFLILLGVGLLFSLGPRLASNGHYALVPLPYLFFLKAVPIFEPIRATARWSMLFYVGLIYFALQTINTLPTAFKRFLVVLGLSVIYMIEVFPTYQKAYAEAYYPDVYHEIANKCQTDSKVLVEYPFDQNKPTANIATNLSYKTKIELASVHHNCDIVNGYSGYEPLDYIRFEHEIDTSVAQNNAAAFFELLDQRNTAIIKLNKQEISPISAASVSAWLTTNAAYQTLANNENYLVAERIK